MVFLGEFTEIIKICVVCFVTKMASGTSDDSVDNCLEERSCQIETLKFPDTLQEFGYGFNKEGRLRKIIPGTNDLGDEGFEFNVSSDQEKNQKHYEALGQVITKYVYDLLETEGQLQKLDVPIDDDLKKGTNNLKTCIFASKDALTNPERLLLLIHGSGAVRAGQWARSLIINDCLETGTQLPYIHRARELGYGVIVLNTNDNIRVDEKTGQTTYIKHSKKPVEHARYVWEHYVRNAKAQHIAIVAHSYGGVVTIDLAGQFSDFRRRVCAVAMTDSVHSAYQMSSKVSTFMKKVGQNWVQNEKTLDTPVDTSTKDVPRVSAGYVSHEMTSASSLESIFKFLETRLTAASSRTSAEESGWISRLLDSLFGR